MCTRIAALQFEAQHVSISYAFTYDESADFFLQTPLNG
jgi:hypothetical protein